MPFQDAQVLYMFFRKQDIIAADTLLKAARSDNSNGLAADANVGPHARED